MVGADMIFFTQIAAVAAHLDSLMTTLRKKEHAYLGIHII